MSVKISPKYEQSQDLLFECLCLMLRAVLRFCLRHAIKLPEILEAVKLMLIRMAEEEINASKGQVNVSRLSVMSGLTRREVMRLWGSKYGKREPLSLTTKIVGRWVSLSKFQNKSGNPRPLAFTGRESEFHTLVASVSNDLNPYTVLFELERSGMVKRNDKQQIILMNHAFEPKNDLNEGMKMLASDSADLMAAVDANLVRGENQTPHLHIATEYDNILSESVPMIKKWLVENGAKFHEKARNYLSKFDKDLNPALKGRKGRARIVLTSFSNSVILQSDSGRKEKV